MIDSVRLHGHSDRPDWQVAVIDGQPRTVVNLPMIAQLVRHSPLGQTAALAALVGHLPADAHAELTRMVGGAK